MATISAARSTGAAEAPDPDAPLVDLARAGAPLRRALARLAGCMLARDGGPAGGWEGLGFVRAGDYAREQLGMSAQELCELARVDAVLQRLPRVEAAFLAGGIPWSKARLLGRVATAEDQGAWLGVALDASAAQLARRVRAVERGSLEAQVQDGQPLDARPETDESGAPEEACDTLRVPCPGRVSGKWGDVRRLALRVAGERLSAADLTEAVTAEALSALLPLESDPASLPPRESRVRCAAAESGPAATPAAADPGASPPGAADPRAVDATAGDPWAPAPVVAASEAADPEAMEPPEPSPFIAALTAGCEASDARELDRRLRRAVALERTLLARLGPLLLELAAEGGFRDLGFTSLDAWARERLGMAPRKARALLRLERACRRSAPLRRAWRSGALSWSKAQRLVAIVLAEGSAPWVPAWLARAEAATVRRLEDDVDQALATGDLDPAALPALPASPAEALALAFPAGVHNGDVSTGGAEDASAGAAPPSTPQSGRPSARPDWRSRNRVRIHGPVPVIRLLRACLFTVQRRIERRAGRPSSQGEALEALLDHVLESWWVAAYGAASPRAIPREHRVFARDGWRCVVPGYSSFRNLHAHHLRFRSVGGSDDPSNLVTLCASHHHHGVHAGTLRIRGTAPDRLRFEMPLGIWLSGDRRLDGWPASRVARKASAPWGPLV